MTTLEDEIIDKLEGRKIKKLDNLGSSGCVNEGHVYEIDDNKKIFVKKNKDLISELMFSGEIYSLNEILNTKTVRVPKPICMVENPENSFPVLIMEYIDKIKNLKIHNKKLGEKLADLHKDNYIKLRRQEKNQNWIKNVDSSQIPIEDFGFEISTCCGRIPTINEWNSDWIQFYARNRIDSQVRMIIEQHTDRLLIEEWSKLQLKIDKLFVYNKKLKIYPSLLHGDLWIENSGEIEEEPILFDPASFYGHSEFDLALTYIFKGFTDVFYESYFDKIKKEEGFELRQDLYQLFHYLNHWNHFGSSYRDQSLSKIKNLNNSLYSLKQ